MPIKIKLTVKSAAQRQREADARSAQAAAQTAQTPQMSPVTTDQSPSPVPSTAVAMAPAPQSDQKVIEDQLKDVIQDLYQIMVQVNSYDQTNRPSKTILEDSIKRYHASVQNINRTASDPLINLPLIPQELIQYVDSGRNPDIYTREFVEGARRSNQLMKGKVEAFADFRDILAAEMAKTMPELREDLGRVLDSTGGRREVNLDGDGA